MWRHCPIRLRDWYSGIPKIARRSRSLRGGPMSRGVKGSRIGQAHPRNRRRQQNHTLRMHCRRLTRLTNAFSRKFENLGCGQSQFRILQPLQDAHRDSMHPSNGCGRGEKPMECCGIGRTLWRIKNISNGWRWLFAISTSATRRINLLST